MSSDALVTPYEYACALYVALHGNPIQSTTSAAHPNANEISEIGLTPTAKQKLQDNLVLSGHLSATAQSERKPDCRMIATAATNG
jgi:hypothetical protein